MAGDLQPLDDKFAIVGPDGRPTLYFIQWAQQRQIDITDAITEAQFNELLVAYLLAHKLQEGSGIQITPSGNLSDSPTIAADVQEILDQISTTRGAVIYRGLLGWAALGPGTAGHFLKTNGAGADPAWAAPATGAFDYLDIKNYIGLANAADTVNVNSTGYVDWGSAALAIDLDKFLFTDFRLVFSASSNQAAQTITAQLTAIFNPAAPIHTGGNDVVITNAFGVFDSGWRSKDTGATSGLLNLGVALKGSNVTVDLAINSMMVMFRK